MNHLRTCFRVDGVTKVYHIFDCETKKSRVKNGQTYYVKSVNSKLDKELLYYEHIYSYWSTQRLFRPGKFLLRLILYYRNDLNCCLKPVT